MRFKNYLTEQNHPTIEELIPDSLLKTKPKENKIKTEADFYRGEAGNRSHITAVIETNIPTKELLKLKGVHDEDRIWRYKHGQWVFGNWTEEKFEEIVTDIIKNGIKEKVFLTADYNNKRPEISEGNHRIAIAKMLGIESVPCEIRFFGKAEDTMSGYWEKMIKELKKG